MTEVIEMGYGADIIEFRTKNDEWRVVRPTVDQFLSDGTVETVSEVFVRIYRRNPLYSAFSRDEPEWMEVDRNDRSVPHMVRKAYDGAEA